MTTALVKFDVFAAELAGILDVKAAIALIEQSGQPFKKSLTAWAKVVGVEKPTQYVKDVLRNRRENRNAAAAAIVSKVSADENMVFDRAKFTKNGCQINFVRIPADRQKKAKLDEATLRERLEAAGVSAEQIAEILG